MGTERLYARPRELSEEARRPFSRAPRAGVAVRRRAISRFLRRDGGSSSVACVLDEPCACNWMRALRSRQMPRPTTFGIVSATTAPVAARAPRACCRGRERRAERRRFDQLFVMPAAPRI
jgi:hypothetical protein